MDVAALRYDADTTQLHANAQSNFHLNNEEEATALLASSRVSSRRPSCTEDSLQESSSRVLPDGSGARLDPSTARQAYEQRVATRDAAVAALEENLAIGLDVVDVASTLLLGHCCRPINDGDQEDQIPEEDSDREEQELLEPEDEPGRPTKKVVASDLDALPPLPTVLHDGSGSPLAPMAHEYARLEGYRWMHSKAHGRGTAFSIERFGTRGECILCPAFCAVRPPESRAFIEAEGIDKRWPATWLQRGLGELCARVRNAPKVPPEGYLKVVEKAPSIVLVVPAGKVVIKADPSPHNFGRKAARRHPMYVDAVEMGARLSICVVPLAQTPSGDLDKVDADLLERTLGAQLFAIAGQRGRLCVRRCGGPPLDSARVAGVSLDGICAYLGAGWTDTLGAMPGSWTRLSVSTARTEALEALLGPPPGLGIFKPLPADTTDLPQSCSYCGLAPVVGCEVLELEEKELPVQSESTFTTAMSDSPQPGLRSSTVCAACSAFVRGSPAYKSKHDLMQYICRPADQMVGTANESLDEALNRPSSPVPETSEKPIEKPAKSASLSPWDSAVPPGSAVLISSCLVHLACPPETWEQDEASTISKLESELCEALKCGYQTARIVSADPVSETGGFCLGVLLLHPATADPAKVLAAPVSFLHTRSITTSYEGPFGPLHLYARLEKHLHRSIKDDVDPNQQLVASSTERAVEPVSVVFCEGAPKANAVEDKPRSLAERFSSANPPQRISCARPFVRGLTDEKINVDDLINSAGEDEAIRAELLNRAGVDPEAEDATDQATQLLHTDDMLRGWLATRVGVQTPVLHGELEGNAHDLFENKDVEAMSGGLQIPGQVSGVKADSDDLLAALLWSFGPSPSQLALRLRELTAAHQAERCQRLLTRWGGADVDGGAQAALAVVGRDAQSFGGQSALDLAIAAGDRAAMDAVLAHVPEFTAHSQDPKVGCGVAQQEDSSKAAAEQAEAKKLSESQDMRSEINALLSKKTEGEAPRPSIEAQEAVAALLNAPNPLSGHTAMYAVALYPSDHTVGFVERLVRRRADPNVRSGLASKGPMNSLGPHQHGETALVAAARRGETSLIEKLIELRADVNARAADGSCILHVSVERGDCVALEALLRAPGCDPNVADPRGRTALVTALKCGCTDLAKVLVRAACDVDARDVNGAAPILHATTVHDESLCTFLLQRRADQDAADPADGSHILHLAIQARNEALLNALLGARADIHAQHPHDGRTPLHLAVGLRMAPSARKLISLDAQVDARSAVGDTPLRLAVQSHDLESVELLCTARADPNSANKSGCAAVHVAVSSGNKKMAQLLVNFRADVHLADSRRWRPIHYGASGGSGEVVEWLLGCRANLWETSYHGRTPHDLGSSGAAEALVAACNRHPPPPGVLQAGPIDVPRLATITPRAKRPASSRTRGKVKPASLAEQPTQAVPSALPQQVEPAPPNGIWTSLQSVQTTDSGSGSHSQSVGTLLDSKGSLGLLPPIVTPSKVRAAGTPRGSKKDGKLDIRLIGTGVHR